MRENNMLLYGQVMANPKVRQTKDENGNYVISAVTINIKVARRMHTYIDKSERYDYPVILAKEEKMMLKIVENVQEGDMVLIKGVLSTLKYPGRVECSNCSGQITWEGQQAYITPIHLVVVKKDLTLANGQLDLNQNDEISNQFISFAHIASPPVYTRSEGDKGTRMLQFQVGINRSFNIKQDPVDKTSDFPIVKMFGGMAEVNKDVLQVGSTIWINGAIQTYNRLRSFQCPYCGEITQKKEIVTEIVPTRVEWVRNCNVPEETEEYDGETE